MYCTGHHLQQELSEWVVGRWEERDLLLRWGDPGGGPESGRTLAIHGLRGEGASRSLPRFPHCVKRRVGLSNSRLPRDAIGAS